MTTIPYDGATPEQLQSPYVQELLAVHGMFRREMATMLHYAESLLSGDQSPDAAATQSRIQSLIRAGMQYTQMLHHHHHLETASLFPVLAANGFDRAIVDRLNREHDEISLLIDQFSGSVRALTTQQPDSATTDLQRLADALKAHLDYEETHVCPALARLSSLQ